MDSNQIIENIKQKLVQTESHFEEELKKVRTGRAHPAMVDGVIVKAYGVAMPLKQLATISATERLTASCRPAAPALVPCLAVAARLAARQPAVDDRPRATHARRDADGAGRAVEGAGAALDAGASVRH